MFQDKSPRDREILLRDNASKIENRPYSRSLDAAEVIELQDSYTRKAIELSAAEEELKMHRENYKAIAKPLKAEMAQIIQGIRSGTENIIEDVYLLPDFEDGMMGYYNKMGELVFSRPLMQNEKQYSISQHLKVVGNE